MALNQSMLSDGTRDPVPLPHEMTIRTVDSGAELSLHVPATSSGPGSGKERTLKATGRIWITDYRLVFVGPSKSDLESLSIPLYQILSTKYEQPTFGANKLVLDISPSPSGALSRGAKAEIKVDGQPLLPIVSTLEKTRERAIEARRAEEDGPPMYLETSAGPSTGAPSVDYSAPPDALARPAMPSDAPPGYDD